MRLYLYAEFPATAKEPSVFVVTRKANKKAEFHQSEFRPNSTVLVKCTYPPRPGAEEKSKEQCARLTPEFNRLSYDLCKAMDPAVRPELLKRISHAAGRTFDQLAADLFGEGMPKSMKRSEVIEVTRDADYMLSYGNDDVAFYALRLLSQKEQDTAMKMAFPHSSYGL